MNRVTAPRLEPAAFSAGALSQLAEGPQDFRAEVIEGLSQPQKSLPCKYFYDAAGVRLFDAITRTPEYYLTRTENALLEKHAQEIAALAGARAHLIEFGSGGSAKARVLLDAFDRPASYVPVDLAPADLTDAASLTRRYVRFAVVPLHADFTQDFQLPRQIGAGRRIGFFPGSTIGNFTPAEASAFLRRTAALLGETGLLIVGVDLKKNKRLLDAAYNDAAGLTAKFNLNLLKRINRELGADFDLEAFTHCAHFNAVQARIEMRIYSLGFQTVRIDGHMFSFSSGESIHTENSHKYSVPDFQTLARRSGFKPLRIWVDEDHLFSLHCLAVAPAT